MIGRREFIALLGSAAAAWPLAGRAQQGAVPVMGFLNAGSPEAYALYLTSFRRGLREAGYVEGQNVAIESRWASGQYDRLPEMAAELVRRPVTVIVANTPAWQFAKNATTTIPIVFATSSDPVQAGLVQSLSRPGGNVTGVTTLTLEVGPKRLELLHELVPMATTLALLINPTSPVLADTELRNVEATARALGVQLHVLHASTEHDFDAVFGTLVQSRAGGLVIGPDVFFNTQQEQLAALSLRYAVPAIYQYREFVAAGGMMSYGGGLTDAYRIAGIYTGRILKGEKPADLRVQQATKVELILNLKTATALGLTVPPALLARADEVIE
jgi:putative tryptophan/tyrosine transport system substrate-binding protein